MQMMNCITEYKLTHKNEGFSIVNTMIYKGLWITEPIYCVNSACREVAFNNKKSYMYTEI
jgi:hypothetical protein